MTINTAPNDLARFTTYGQRSDIWASLVEDQPREARQAGWNAIAEALEGGIALDTAVESQLVAAANGAGTGRIRGVLEFMLTAIEAYQDKAEKKLQLGSGSLPVQMWALRRAASVLSLLIRIFWRPDQAGEMRKRTRRKVWNSAYNPVRAAVVSHSFSGKAINMEIQELMALDEIRSGRFDEKSLMTMQSMIAISRRLIDAGIGLEMAEHCRQAERILGALYRDGVATVEQADALAEVTGLHQAQRELAGPAAYGLAAAPFCKLSRT